MYIILNFKISLIDKQLFWLSLSSFPDIEFLFIYFILFIYFCWIFQN